MPHRHDALDEFLEQHPPHPDRLPRRRRKPFHALILGSIGLAIILWALVNVQKAFAAEEFDRLLSSLTGWGFMAAVGLGLMLAAWQRWKRS